MTHAKNRKSEINPEFQGYFVGRTETGGSITQWYVPQNMNTKDVISETVGSLTPTKGDMIVTIYHHDYSYGMTFTYLNEDEISFNTLQWLKKVSYGKALKNPNNQGVIRTISELKKLTKPI